MNRTQKQAVIAELHQAIGAASATLVVKYKGTSVAGLQNLRRLMKGQHCSFKVAKARLMRIAAEQIAGADAFAASLKDQVGLVFAHGDVSAVAKSLVAFASKNETISLLAGFFEKSMLSAEQVKQLAMLPSREILLSQVVGTMQAPIAQFVRLLHMLVARLLYVLKRIEEQKA